MTRLKFGAIVIDARGKIGGHILGKGLHGNYIGTKTPPKKITTIYQKKIRDRFRQISSAWADLSVYDRESWNQKIHLYTRTNVFRDLKNPTGKNLHQQLNLNLLLSDQNLVDTCPDPLPVHSPGIENVEAEENPTSLKIQTSFDTTGNKIMCYATGIVSAGVTSVRQRLRFIGSRSGDLPGTFDFSEDYNNRFAPFQKNDHLFVAIKTINQNGESSNLTIVKTKVTEDDIIVDPVEEEIIYRVQMGSTEEPEIDGNINWIACNETDYSIYNVNNVGYNFGSNSSNIDMSGVDTAIYPPNIFKFELSDRNKNDEIDLRYEFPISGAGAYKIDILLAELYHQSAGKRLFNVYVQDILEWANIDLYVLTGGFKKAGILSKTVTLTQTDTVLTMHTKHSDPKIDNPAIVGIQVTKMN